MFLKLFRVEKLHRTLLLRHRVHVHRPFAPSQLAVPNALYQLVVITVGLAVVDLAFYLHELVAVLDRRLGVQVNFLHSVQGQTLHLRLTLLQKLALLCPALLSE